MTQSSDRCGGTVVQGGITEPIISRPGTQDACGQAESGSGASEIAEVNSSKSAGADTDLNRGSTCYEFSPSVDSNTYSTTCALSHLAPRCTRSVPRLKPASAATSLMEGAFAPSSKLRRRNWHVRFTALLLTTGEHALQ